MLVKIVQEDFPVITFSGFNAIESIEPEFKLINNKKKKKATTLIIINNEVKLLFSKKPFLLRRYTIYFLEDFLLIFLKLLTILFRVFFLTTFFFTSFFLATFFFRIFF